MISSSYLDTFTVPQQRFSLLGSWYQFLYPSHIGVQVHVRPVAYLSSNALPSSHAWVIISSFVLLVFLVTLASLGRWSHAWGRMCVWVTAANHQPSHDTLLTVVLHVSLHLLVQRPALLLRIRAVAANPKLNCRRMLLFLAITEVCVALIFKTFPED